MGKQKNKECNELLNKYYDKIDYDDFAKYNSENWSCKNPTTLTNIPIGLFDEKGLIKIKDGNDIWCYTYDEYKNSPVYGIDDINFHTMKKFDSKQVYEDNGGMIKKKNYPTVPFDILLKQKLFDRMCPIFKSKKKGEYFFKYDRDDLTLDKYNKFIDENPYFVEFELNMSAVDHGLSHIYRVTYNNENDFKNRVNTESLKLVYNTWNDDTVKPEKTGMTIKDPKLVKELQYFLAEFGRDMTSISEFDRLNIKPSRPIKVYRGIQFGYNLKIPKYIQKPFIGKKITLEDTKAQIWTTNLCMAINFASGVIFGVVYSTFLTPEDIIIDTRQLDLLYLKDIDYKYLYFSRQNAIIAKPGKKEVTVELIINHIDWTGRKWINPELEEKYKE